MKAIRSLEQHVDCLMSYDFTASFQRGADRRASDRRRYAYLENCRGDPQGISYDEIHEITKIDVWFIDKLAILVEMEQALKRPKS